MEPGHIEPGLSVPCPQFSPHCPQEIECEYRVKETAWGSLFKSGSQSLFILIFKMGALDRNRVSPRGLMNFLIV